MQEQKNIKASMPIVETNTRKGDAKALEALQKQWLNKQISFDEYIAEVRTAGGEVIFGVMDVTEQGQNKLKIEQVMQSYQKGEMSLHETRRIIEDLGANATFWDWELDKNPNYASEDSKIGFTWNPHHNKKGRFMQHVTKRILIKMCDFAYNSISKYDKDAYKFSDSRLLQLRKHINDYLNDNLIVQYKKDFIAKLIDIAFFILKEDVYYRVLALKMINEMPLGFDITEEEMIYFKREMPKQK